MSRSRFIITQLPWIGLMIIITIQSSTAKVKLPDVGWQDLDKLVHFFVFGILGWLLIRGMSLSEKVILRKYAFTIALIGGFLFALSDEFHQSFTPGRYSDWADWLADALGILSFTLFYKFSNRKKTASTN